ncbi:hypothetical protein DRQ36_11350, partial [bacterium]
VFFEQNSAEIDSRFSPLLDLLAERLVENPDVEFVVNGYFDSRTETDSVLASERAVNLMNALVRRAPSAADRISLGDTDPARKRVDRESQFEQYQLWIDEENRCAEITVVMPEIRFDIDRESLTDREANAIADKMAPYLVDNPFAVAVVRCSETGIELSEALDCAFNLKSQLENHFPENVRNRILASSSNLVPEGKSEFVLSGEGILYRPKEIHSALSFVPEVLAECEIKNRVKTDLKIAQWSIVLADRTGRSLWDIVSGKGDPPAKISWDWRDPEGGLLPFGKRFTLCLEVEDELGQKSKACSSKEIGTDVTRLEERTDRLLLVQFVFDAPAAQSQYLQDRLEDVARHIIERGSLPDVTLDAELQGHTDEIGGERRNIELSEERAVAVERRLRAYMQTILSLPDSASLDRWMTENNVTVVSKGYADTDPYTLDLWRGGKLEKVVVGKNGLPEGRNINRRVLVVIHETRGKESENE